MKIERYEDPGLVMVNGVSGVVLRVKEFQPDLSDYSPTNDLWNIMSHRSWGPVNNSLAAICEVVAGSPPEYWDTCNPYGHYRVSIKSLRRISPLELLALQSS